MAGDIRVDMGQYIIFLKRAADKILDIIQEENQSDAMKWSLQHGVLTEFIFRV